MKKYLICILSLLCFQNISFTQECNCGEEINLVTNPNFSAGNTGFQSEFIHDTGPNCLYSSYEIVSQPIEKCDENGWLSEL